MDKLIDDIEKILNKLKSHNINNNFLIEIDSLVSDLDENIDKFIFYSLKNKEYLSNTDIEYINEYKINKDLINKLFPIFHYYYEIYLNNNDS